MKITKRVVIVLGVLLLLNGPASAFVGEAKRMAKGYKPARESSQEKQERLSGQKAWKNFLSQHGPDWKVEWNEKTRTPHRVYGKGIFIPEARDLKKENAERVARNFIKRYATLLRVKDEDLKLLRAAKHKEKWYITFQQYHQGLPVYQGKVDLRFTQEGKLVMFGSDAHPDIDISTSPSILEEEAIEIAKKDCGFGEKGDRVAGSQLLIYPLETEETIEYRLSWKVEVQIREPIGNWIYYIDAHNGEVLLKYNDIRFETVSGTASGKVLPLYYNDTPTTKTFQNETVTISSDSADYEWTLSSDPGWTIQGDYWAFGTPTGGGGQYGNADPTSGHTGSNVYGYNLIGDYPNNLLSIEYLTTGAINCSGLSNTGLRFYRWLGVEESKYDNANIQVSNNGSTWTTVWSNPSSATKYVDHSITDSSLVQRVYDISTTADGKSTVYIRWGMGTTDSSWKYCGWNIDDIQIVHDTKTDNTNSSGNYSVTVSAAGDYNVSAQLEGPYVQVIYEDGSEADYVGTATAGTSYNWTWGTGNTTLGDYDELNVFYHVNVAHDHIKNVDSSFTKMDYVLPAVVRLGTNYNNAYWSSSDGGIAFGKGDGVSYRNFSHFADVIYHEYTHGVTHKLYDAQGGSLPYTGESGAIDEGLSDYFACTITGESQIGEGGLVVGQSYMRNLDNTLKVPDDWAGEVHDDGRIIGGALWDLREAVGATIADDRIHDARYDVPDDFSDFLTAVLSADDTVANRGDNNISNGTPYSTQIYAAFAAHGIPQASGGGGVSGGGGGGGGGGSGCLIAIAAYGTPMAEEERILCQFRDRYLLTNRAGRAFISLYNRISPPVANFIRDREILKKIVRFYLKPVVWTAEKILK